MLKLDILLEAKVIQQDTHQFALAIVKLLEQEYNLDSTDYEAMITHLVMATERIKGNTVVEAMAENIFLAIKEKENFALAVEILEQISRLSIVEYPCSEQQYLLLHLCNVIKGGDGHD